MGEPGRAKAPRSTAGSQTAALVGVVTVFVLAAVLIAVATPAWEANDEPAHFTNAATLAEGRMYRVETGGLEAHQPPLYYLLLAAEMRLLRIDTTDPSPPHSAAVLAGEQPLQGWLFDHAVPTDRADTRRLVPLRLLSVGLGVITVLCAFGLARLMTDNMWTPLLAALIVAFVPRFGFLSGVVNNGNLAIACSSLAILLVGSTIASSQPRHYLILIAAGAILGAGMLAKMTVAPVALVLVVAVGVWSDDRLRSLLSIVAPLILVFGVWPLRNTIVYGDPLLTATATEHWRVVLPALVLESPTFHRAFVELPQGIWSSFWYTSGGNQFRWVWWAYIPYWTLAAIGFGGLAAGWSRRPVAQRRVAVLAIAVGVAALANVWLIGMTTTQNQARWSFVGLVAFAALIAVGTEWIRWEPLRFLLPIVGFVGLVYAIQTDVLLISS